MAHPWCSHEDGRATHRDAIVAILRNVLLLGVNSRYVFPSLLSRERPMSENTVNNALRRLGYSNQEMTGHGFRSMASTLLSEQG
jgi:hypothetical protein